MKKFLLGFLIISSLIFATPSLAVNYAPLPTPKPATPNPRSCQARESAVKNRMTSLVKLAGNMEDKFGAIAKRIEDFYTNTVIPSGKTVGNYDALVSTIETKKNAVSDALTKAQNNVDAFSCTSGDPKALLNQFRLNMQAVKNALRDYRTSIKNLIVAVHSVSPTPKPTKSPEGANQ